MSTSIQLDPETEALLSRLAHTQHRTKSDVLREAVRRLAEDARTKKLSKAPTLL